MRARVRRDHDRTLLAKRVESPSWQVRASACLPQGERISNPLIGEDADGTYAVLDTGATPDLSLIDVLVKAQLAKGALLVLESDANVELLELVGYTAFTIEGCEQLFAANYPLPDAPWLTKVAFDKGDLSIAPGDPGALQPEQDDELKRVATRKPVLIAADKADRIAAHLICGSADVIKADDADDAAEDERFIMGVVLEPDEVDSQGDTITPEEVRSAAHGYMEDYGNVGLQHQTFINGKVKILESYICPVDCTIGGQLVKAGTWLMAFRVLDDTIWEAVKSGLLTGLSIGGLGTRVPA